MRASVPSISGLVCLFAFAWATADEPEPAKLVDDLVRQLVAKKPEDRDLAEKALLEIPLSAIEHLPALDDPKLSPEQTLRLARVIPVLQERLAMASLDASVVRLSHPKLPLSQFLREIEQQTKNRVVDLRPELNQEAPDLEIDLGEGPFEFWPLLDRMTREEGWVLYPNQANRSLGLARGETPPAPTFTSHALRFRLNRILCRRNFATPMGESICEVDVTCAAEPRVRLLELQVPAERFKAEDDRGRAVGYLGPDRAHLTFDEGSIEVELALRFACPDRTATSLALIAGGVEGVVPFDLGSFEFSGFPNDKPVRIVRGPIAVTLFSFKVEDEGIWAARLRVERTVPIEESHLASTLSNELWLVDRQGKVFPQDGGMSAENVGNGQIDYEYLFVDNPGSIGDYRLMVQIPAGLVRIPVDFEFRDIPLP